MNIAETIRFLETSDDVDACQEAFGKLNDSVTEKDLPLLLAALESKTSNFAVRESLAEPIIRLAGARALPELMVALRRNFEEGWDNDLFQTLLMDLAESDPQGLKAKLEEMAGNPGRAQLEDIRWLLGFCR